MSKRAIEIMKKAYEKRVLIPAFNAAYPEMVKPICEAIKETGCIGMLEVARPDIEKFGAISFSVIFEEYKKYADPAYVTIHQDHVPVIDEDGVRVDYKSLIEEAINLGYDSVMIDGSRLSLDENIRVTKEIVSMAHGAEIPVEAELGAVLGHESGPLPPYEELFNSGQGFTDPDDAARFVRETGVDWLSVAVGNIHGAITGAAKDQKKISARLNIEHLRKIRDATGVPLVLHGGSGIQKEYIMEAVKNGLTKINIGTEIRQAYEKELKSSGNVEKAREAVKNSMYRLIREYYEVENSKSIIDG